MISVDALLDMSSTIRSIVMAKSMSSSPILFFSLQMENPPLRSPQLQVVIHLATMTEVLEPEVVIINRIWNELQMGHLKLIHLVHFDI